MTLEQIVAAVQAAHASHTPLRLRGAGSKDFYGGLLAGEVLDLSGYRGIVAYEPTELYLTARCGTPLAEIEAVRRLNAWGGQPLPVSGSFWHDGKLWVRLSGAGAAVEAASKALGGHAAPQGDFLRGAVNPENLWKSVVEQTHPAFASPVLWRMAVPTTAPDAALDGLQAIEWGGGLRWYAGEQPAIRGAAARLGGHATLYRAPESLRCLEDAFTPLSPALLALHRRLKKAFDPKGILNPGRLYAEF